MTNIFLNRRGFLAGAIASACALPALADKVFTHNKLAIRGYDPVAYFTKGAPTQGQAKFTATFDGATWQFSSLENQKLFEANPAKYAPQYGGYCAYAVSKGYTAKTQPDAWHIVNDKLYLNFNTKVREIWRQDIPGNVKKADANWPEIRASL